MRGRFISFEGGEGAGKSTHSKLLAERLQDAGIEVVVTREPGGSPGAEIIRHIILSGAAKPLGAEAETMLFASARDDHLRTTIRPALERGAWVLCDRFADSTRVYQGIVGEVDLRLIQELERITVGETVPDLTFVLDVPAEVGLARAGQRRGPAHADRFESEALEFHEKLRAGFRTIAQSEPDRCVLIDVTAPRADVAEQIWNIVETRLNPATAAPTVDEAAP
ncbi:MAG: dTMP kinase [Alphaproteobacteria bacterium]|jgi:dTMP kinase|nr:dTMP kinase [Alphaproteobacteria bacterium]